LTERDEETVEIGGAYPFAQLARASLTASSHEDEGARARARERAAKWMSVLTGMASGRLGIGSRTPVAGLPAWVTPEVVRGGFATGNAAAGGKPELWERRLADRLGIQLNRGAIFAHFLTEEGLAELTGMLDGGGYRVRVPEEAALPIVAWLVRAGETERALALVETLAPLSGRLRFAPKPAEPDPVDASIVWREPAGKAKTKLERRRPDARVETMRETLTVWNPFADALLAHWLETVQHGRVAAAFPDGWAERGKALLGRYEALARQHTLATKHRNPKENLAILRTALEEQLRGGGLSPRRAGLLQHAVDAMVRRRGTPGAPEHAALRARQAADAALPTHHAIARVVVRRLAALPAERGVETVDPLLAPVTAEEAEESGIPAATEIPPSIARPVRRTLAGTPERLIEEGLVASAEVLAELVPRISAATIAEAYEDPALRPLMAAHYEAFRNRRSLLLLDLERQVQVEELPWVQAVAPFKRPGAVDGAVAALKRLTELTFDAFPAIVIPNPLLQELAALARAGGLDLPLTEELAADIFMGRFSKKFPRAAAEAGELLAGSLYARYYGIDYARIPSGDGFSALCRERAGFDGQQRSVAANGTVIEQAQILTTHNLAALTRATSPDVDWRALADRCFGRALALHVRLAQAPPRSRLGTVKDIAYAWRQMLFFLSMLDAEAQVRFAATLRERASARLLPAVAGLEHVLAGGDADSGEGRRLLGWTVGPHWLLAGL
jgi:hypothetical protein